MIGRLIGVREVIDFAVGKAYGAHRLAFFYVNGVWPKHEIDHINGDPGDNRIANLRDVPRAINAQNRHLARRDSTTGLQGIERRRDRWLVSIGVNGKKRYLGSFGSPEEAVRFRDQAKAELHPGSPHYRLGAVTASAGTVSPSPHAEPCNKLSPCGSALSAVANEGGAA